MYEGDYTERGGETLDYMLNSPDGFEETKEASEKIPNFPVFVFFIAVLKDTVDILFFGTFGVILAPFVWIILTVWLFGKGSFLMKHLVKKEIAEQSEDDRNY